MTWKILQRPKRANIRWWHWPADTVNNLRPWYAVLWALPWALIALALMAIASVLMLIADGPTAARNVWGGDK